MKYKINPIKIKCEDGSDCWEPHYEKIDKREDGFIINPYIYDNSFKEKEDAINFVFNELIKEGIDKNDIYYE